MNPEVDTYISKAKKWQQEIESLRAILLNCGLTEEFKWGKPCYSYQKSNLVIIQPFKEYFALLFFKGYLLQDPDGVLVKTGENTKVGRQIRFKDVSEITRMESILKKYINQAIEVDKSDVQVRDNMNTEIQFPQELHDKFEENPALKKAFKALTPGRQRAYNFYFSAPKQSKTRESRIEKHIAQILDGKGLND